MAPSITEVSASEDGPSVAKAVNTPLRPEGSLDQFEKFDVTTVIGTEFSRNLQLTDLLSSPNSDSLIRDLAVLGFLPLSKLC